jgi:hypothetical protein
MQSVVVTITQGSAEAQWVAIAKWSVQVVSGFFLLATFLLTYRQNAKVRAADLLLKLEERFNSLGSKLAFLEYKRNCYDPIKGILTSFSQDPDNLSESERQTLRDIDECIRFFYICSLHAGETVHSLRRSRWSALLTTSRLPHAYYYYLKKFHDPENRPELGEYVRRFYPNLWKWLDRNKSALGSAE